MKLFTQQKQVSFAYFWSSSCVSALLLQQAGGFLSWLWVLLSFFVFVFCFIFCFFFSFDTNFLWPSNSSNFYPVTQNFYLHNNNNNIKITLVAVYLLSFHFVFYLLFMLHCLLQVRNYFAKGSAAAAARAADVAEKFLEYIRYATSIVVVRCS